MPFKEGIVGKVYSKELDTPDQYGNTHRRSMKVGDDWFGLPTGKSGESTIPGKGDKRHVLKEGDKIEFMYEEKGDFRNVKLNKITLVEAVAPTSAPTGGAATNGKKAPYEAGIKVGHAINNAVHLALFEKDTSFDKLKEHAIKIMRLSAELESEYNEIVAQKGSEKKEVRKKEEVQQDNQVVEDNPVSEFEDEDPF